MAARASAAHRYGVTATPGPAGVAVAGWRDDSVVDMGPPGRDGVAERPAGAAAAEVGDAGPSSSRSIRSRSSAAKAGGGASGRAGRRRASSGSAGMVAPFGCRRRPGRRCRARTSSASVACRVRPSSSATSATREPVQVAQGEGAAVGRAQSGQHRPGHGHVQAGRPRDRPAARAAGPPARSLRSSRPTRRQWSTSLWRATPTNQAVVSSGHRAALHGADRGQEGLGRQVLGHRLAAAARHQVAVHLGQGPVVEGEQGGSLVVLGWLVLTHTASSSRGPPLRRSSGDFSSTGAPIQQANRRSDQPEIMGPPIQMGKEQANWSGATSPSAARCAVGTGSR